MKTFFRLAGLVRPYAWWMLLAAVLGFATIGSSIGLLMTSAYIIAKAVAQSPLAELQIGILGIRVFSMARGLLRYLERLVSHNTTFRILTKLRVWFYESLEPLAPARLLHFRSGDLLQRIVEDIQSLENIYVRVLAPPLIAGLVAFLMWFLIGVYSLQAALVLLCFQLLAAIAVPVLTMQLSRGIARGIMAAEADQQVAALDYAQGMSELWLFGRTGDHLERMASLQKRKLTLQRRNAVIQSMHESLTGLLMNGAVIAVLLAVIPSVKTGALSGLSVSVIALAVIASFEAFLPLSASMQHLEADIHAGNRLFEIIDAKPEVTAPPKPVAFPRDHTIEAKGLSFTYPGSPRKTLDNLTFKVPHGSSIAIVGPSGAGKSTITSLLLRFWNVKPGTLSVGGTDIRDLDPEELRRRIGVVSQRTYLFGESIRENLHIAAPEATDAMLKEALSTAGLDHFHDKLDMWAGQHGMQLSGGERQRMAIARMILQDAPIIILDEATANLDALTEESVSKTLGEITRKRTLIAITHRLRRMEHYQCIIVLHEGKIIEEGSHYELMARKGFYANMWHLQHEEFIGES